ncbi:MAG: histidine triad nucleotide-binding protein [Betaproteobacteria bacterium]|nr:histidine triad nucleotide-binding protein [Betaproteobacteria bacterium]NBT75079.1 histidine triad nucleotide-binding protein [Betaproteobacteria bacterium]NBY13361.1 histidine triad nucleotide-binding protein [Betaproteobacteria bacterium]NCA16253.1 histidine triad nucleotide-binding protein [Betaproteobacteria bacterium]NDF04328.1 histidine triad nucleotide-binding protein [Betaproteobacteria bacterium]
MNCIFCKIIAGDIPAKKVFEDEEMLAFWDIHPKAPLHLLLIPKEHIASMGELAPEHAPLIGRMMVKAQHLAAENGSPEGFRTVVNTGRVGRQEVYHLHLHLLGGPEPLGVSASF